VPLPGSRNWRCASGTSRWARRSAVSAGLETSRQKLHRKDRAITAQLYGGRPFTPAFSKRSCSESAAIRAPAGHWAACRPSAHMKRKGTRPFTGLERIRLPHRRTRAGIFAVAFLKRVEKPALASPLTTPVPAGNDSFPMPMIEQYLGEYMAKMGVNRNALAGTRPAASRQRGRKPFGHGRCSRCVWANTSNGR